MKEEGPESYSIEKATHNATELLDLIAQVLVNAVSKSNTNNLKYGYRAI